MNSGGIKMNKVVFAGLFLLSVCCRCTQSEVVSGDGHKKGEEIEVGFRLNVLTTTMLQTRSDTTVVTRSQTDPGETADKTLQNLWAGQYDSKGDLVAEEYFSSLATQESVNLPLKRIEGICHVWVVANAGNLSGKADSENDLNTLTTSTAFTEEGLPVGNLCVMTGMWSGTITENIDADIQLKRSLAKIKFAYSVGGENFSFIPSTLELCNVPKVMKYTGENAPEQLSGDGNYKNYTVTSPGTSGVHFWYVPENPAGMGTNGGDRATEKTGEGVSYATCIKLSGEAVQDGVTYGNVVFTLYPGAGNNDYNVVRNGFYAIEVTLTGIDFTDKRVTVGSVPEMEDPENLGPEKGATGIFQVTTRPGVSWAFTIPGWLSATVGGKTYESGNRLDFIGPYKVEFNTTTANPRAEVRETSFKVGEKEIKVRQDPSSLEVGAQSVSLAAENGSTGSGTFKATAGLPWSATLETEWGNWLGWNGDAPVSGTEASGTNETLAIKTLSANPSASSRTGTLLIKGGDAISDASYPDLTGSISVTQAGATVTSSKKSYSISPEKADNLSVDFTATSDLPWVASVTTGDDWLTLTSKSGTTTGTSQSVGYKASLNLSSSTRSGKIGVRVGNEAGDIHPGPLADITVEQAGSTFNVTLPSSDINADGGSVNGHIFATEGLSWIIKPENDNGITVSPTSGLGNADLTFSALSNANSARSGNFVASVVSAPSRAINITVSQQAGVVYIITINQSTVDSYVSKLNRNKNYPPFNSDEGILSGTAGSDYKGTSSTYTISTPYTIEIEDTQSTETYVYSTNDAWTHCTVKGEGWRLPTHIELFAMWDKCKGTNNNASDEESNSNTFGAKFLGYWYWSCSVRTDNMNKRCGLNFSNGNIASNKDGITSDKEYVRCVRDLN
ncbi:BACON domain-containing protein [Parabacteroides chongii]|uniref:BACON domain-containing protein n=1 Tax=Parabacteroides chongii TaxID=2685834 RepID=UPI00240D7151|nr:BACON domain-containing carbohydrate-binding protein [Parabacteroides chongii]WFE84342.1 BACON domain-containing carbohydrate-binding protein [Parabacteroides chongii]